MESLIRDVTYSLKILKKDRTFSATVLVTRALCIDHPPGRTGYLRVAGSLPASRRDSAVRDPEAFDLDGDYGEGYTFIAETVIPGYDQVFEAVLALLHTHLGSEGHFLLVGCGTGKEIEHLTPPSVWVALHRRRPKHQDDRGHPERGCAVGRRDV